MYLFYCIFANNSKKNITRISMWFVAVIKIQHTIDESFYYSYDHNEQQLL